MVVCDEKWDEKRDEKEKEEPSDERKREPGTTHLVVQRNVRVRVRQLLVRCDRVARTLSTRVARVEVPVDDLQRAARRSEGERVSAPRRSSLLSRSTSAAGPCWTPKRRTGVASLLEDLDLRIVNGAVRRAEEARLGANDLLERALDEVELLVELARRDLSDVDVCVEELDVRKVFTGWKRGREEEEEARRTAPRVRPDRVPLRVRRLDLVGAVVDAPVVVAVDEEGAAPAGVGDRLRRLAAVQLRARGARRRSARSTSSKVSFSQEQERRRTGPSSKVRAKWPEFLHLV